MRVYYHLDNFKSVPFPVVTMGSFDGVHFGHRKIIERMNFLAKKHGGETVLITFFPHPRQVLFPDANNLRLLNTQKEKIELLRKAGIDNLIIFPFTIEFSKISCIDFIRKYLVEKIKTKLLVIGYDHHFGNNREGDFEHLFQLGKFYGFEVEEIKAQDINYVAVSSTKIRKALSNGDVQTANRYLGYHYSIFGKVVYGNMIGRTLGFPTANIEIEDKLKLVPAFGVYAVIVEHNGLHYKGMINIGIRPTLDLKKPTIEVNIFDFDRDIYGEAITVFFIEKIRDEQKFQNLELLKDQLKLDKQHSLEVLSKTNYVFE